ncbi:hypothetical protein DSO57_1000012 [Entomophthora muscae]|uniref:Uncharacterized protein n=1 Tax=Entomophthora muscae TaxID=34485 RepID=A0ACC2SMB8_9FUNG|nr:hypothetical protein DSO57_1000012 [Entomophthora muscae]
MPQRQLVGEPQPRQVTSILNEGNLEHPKPTLPSNPDPVKKDIVSLFRKKSEEPLKESQPPEGLLKRLASIRNNKRASEIQHSVSPASSLPPPVADLEASKRLKLVNSEAVRVDSSESLSNLSEPHPFQLPCPSITVSETIECNEYPKLLDSAFTQFLGLSKKESLDLQPESNQFPGPVESSHSVTNSYSLVQNTNQTYVPLADSREPIPKEIVRHDDSTVISPNGANFPQSKPHFNIPRIQYASISEPHYPSQITEHMSKLVPNNFPMSSPSIAMPSTSYSATCVNHMGQSLDSASTDYATVVYPNFKGAVYSDPTAYLQGSEIHNNLVQHGEPSPRLFVNDNGQLIWRQSHEPFNRAGVIKQFLSYIGFTSQTAEMMINSEGQDKMEVFQDQFLKFSEWCCERDYDPWTFSEVIGLNYITEVSRDQDFITLEAIRDALSSTWALVHGDRNLFKDSPRVLLFFKGLRMNLTRKPKLLPTVNPHLPFSLFKKWGTNAELSHTQLCQKTAFLIIAVTSWNSLDLSRIILSQVQSTASNSLILNSVDSDSRKIKRVELQEFSKNITTCPVQAIRDYTQWFRPTDADNPSQCLFGPTPNPNNRVNASPKMIDMWIQNLFMTAERELADASC